MTKDEVALIIFKVTADGQEAVNMKLYKDGTTCRCGVGGLPQLGISGMSLFGDARFFDPVIAKVPDEILEKPIVYEEATPNGYLEYVMAFYGVSRNAETGERADWSKSTGVSVKLDHQSNFGHPVMGLLDNLVMDALQLTNDWYFDVVVNAKYKVLSSTLPKHTLISLPKTEMELERDYANYVTQMVCSARKWQLVSFVKHKTYEIDGLAYEGVVQQSDAVFSLDFVPSGDPSGTDMKPWWKLW